MTKRLLDTSVLIAHWRRCAAGSLLSKSEDDARRWARTLVELHQTGLIATPVVVEFLAGTRSGHELKLARAYLGELEVVDEGRVSEKDWETATRYAERVLRDGKPGQLGDCLVKAIADRLKCDVFSLDEAFS